MGSLNGEIMNAKTFSWSGAAKHAGQWLLTLTLMLNWTQTAAQPLARSFGVANQSESIPSANLLLASDRMLYGAAWSGGPSNCGCVFKLATNGSAYTALHYFSGADGANPAAGLLEGSDGFLYGTTFSGGASNAGCVFQLNQSGSSYAVLHSFTGVGGDGANPAAALIEATNGLLYGTTSAGGVSSNGIIFSIGKNGGGYNVVMAFAGTNGANPSTALYQASDGGLYGATDSGGTWTNGTVFSLRLDGSGFTNLWFFSGTNGDGADPSSSLLEGNDGALYGITHLGGVTNAGAVYKLNKDGSNYQVLYSFLGFTGGDGENPFADLKLASDGALYGTTLAGGANDAGTVFKLNPDGSGYAILHQFTGAGGEGRYPQSALFEAPDGMLYGTTGSGGNGEGGTLFKLNKDASGFVTLKPFFAFAGGDGFYPANPLLAASDGKLYGTTVKGGQFVAGTVFGMNPDGTASQIIHHFGTNSGDGTDPRGGLVEGADGGLYGATYSGGSSNAGTIFRLNKDGSGYAVLLNFGSNTNDARNPYGGLVQGSDGNLYGTTVFGGTNQTGAIFRMATNGTAYTILRNLGGSARSPTNSFSRLVEYPAGTFYGTTADGGTNGAGTLFRIKQDGSGFAIVRSFNQDANGWRPLAGVIRASDGLLYGTTYLAGGNGAGTLYRMATNGTGFTLLDTLSLANDGVCRASLLEASDGTLYASACGNGSLGYGDVFKINKSGTGYTVMSTFGAASGGLYSKATLIQGADGTVYGGTAAGGAGWGTIFALPWQPPTIVTQPQTLVTVGGGSNSLSVVAGEWPMNYQWLLNGVPIANATSACWPINPLSLAQAGNYQVIISNNVGSVTSVVATVTAFTSDWYANQFRFTIGGPLGAGYRVEFRNNLADDWSFLTNFLLTASPSQINDPNSGVVPQRFYRLVLSP